MNLISRMVRGLLLATALSLTCIGLMADWLFERGSLADSYRDCMALLEAHSKYEQLTSEAQSTVKRIQVKSRIAEALRDRAMTLIDAAAYFRSLHEESKSWHDPNRPRPELKDGEGWCRVVIEWTMRHNSSLQFSSGQTDALRERLERELQEQLEGHGSLILPQ